MYTATAVTTGMDLWILPLDSRKPFPFFPTKASESSGQFSPDMRWIAYVSDESGRKEVYVRPFSPDNLESASTGKWMVSKNGGVAPKWRLDGKEITYLRPDGKLMAAGIPPGAAFHSVTPRELVQLAKNGEGPVDVASDGRVIQAISLEKDAPAAFAVVLNWHAALKK